MTEYSGVLLGFGTYIYDNFSFLSIHFSKNRTEKGGFSRPHRPHDGDEGALGYAKVNVFEGGVDLRIGVTLVPWKRSVLDADSCQMVI